MATFAATCIRKFDEIGDERLHHPSSRLYLSQTMPHSFRVHVEALADRSALIVVNLPTIVRLFICRVRLWSFLETSTEEKHARLTRTILGRTNWSGALVALALGFHSLYGGHRRIHLCTETLSATMSASRRNSVCH